jgi:hypothetical protein
VTQPDESGTPDYAALRDTRPDPQGGPDDELASQEGPATASENSVEEEMGSGGS